MGSYEQPDLGLIFAEAFDPNRADNAEHYGTPRHSGRYPWGSGDDPYQHNSAFMQRYNELHDGGMSEKDIATGLGMSIKEMRARKSYYVNCQKEQKIKQVKSMMEKGYTIEYISNTLDIADGTVRNYAKDAFQYKTDKYTATCNLLKKQVDSKQFIEVGAGVNLELGVSNETLSSSLTLLKDQGYEVYTLKVPQASNPGKYTTSTVLCPPGTTFADLTHNQDKIQSVQEYFSDDGKTVRNIYAPSSLDASRVMVRYAEEGGLLKDGEMEIRRGCEDLSLGGSQYAQVRIAVNGTHYLKGMAVYSDGSDMPDGVDVIFNTNKHEGTPMLGEKDHSVLKPLKDDPANPFGATIKTNGQYFYTDKDGKQQLSPVNKVNEEGDWGEWSKTVSSQFLGKQSLKLIQRQLDLTYAEKKSEFDEIMSLQQPEIKKALLESFAEDCDASAVHLKATGFPRQASHVILPLSTIGDNEIYAPNYKDGEQVALVRHPHQGIFEIPILTVNNKNQEGNATIGKTAKDAVGISHNTAEHLSGADFDGDSVLVIPVNSNVRIKNASPLKDLENWDNKESYGEQAWPNGYKRMTKAQKGMEMGKISNLITDMTIQGADEHELARAVKHAMVVIDAEKHNLNYEQSYIDQGIDDLKQRYQRHEDGTYGGSSTLLSRNKSPVRVGERKEGEKRTDPETGVTRTYKYDPETGEKLYTYTDRTYVDKNGKVQKATIESTKMYETKDARTLSSGYPQEELYAKYANDMKALGNTARKAYLETGSTKVNSEAKAKYKDEVASLNANLTIALKNAPRERMAQIMANNIYREAKAANPDIADDDEKKKKIKTSAISVSRSRYGAKKALVPISDSEWDAIMSGALSSNKISQIIANTDQDAFKKRALPRESNGLSDAKISRLKAMAKSGNYTTSELADALGISTSSVSKYLANS